MSEEPYRPREDDHLVEPVFAGLGVGDEEGAESERDDVRRPGWLARLWRALLRR